jgi:hypothetical protein
MGKHRDGLFLGAACCDILWPDGALVGISRGRLVTRQSGSPPDVGNEYVHFEDEDSLPDEGLVSVLGRSVSERSRDYEAIPIAPVRTLN